MHTLKNIRGKFDKVQVGFVLLHLHTFTVVNQYYILAIETSVLSSHACVWTGNYRAGSFVFSLFILKSI